ncbi:homocysteine S-methyltransferase family protein [Schumannella sp. 10F1B-5-1]|uniref:homocysteine S-methyltransferase family protein n=1 Tax=Schumannella sp. 10F1B-5-1 TaxID=2590780 RepID=UPI0015E86505|nr:homocysteine S-methyltransferase family protein [Schumannella sp. 10F1B-5-1]
MPFRIPRTDPGAVTLTDGGLETDLIYGAGFDLPDFAAFPLLDDEHGREALAAYYRLAIETAQDAHAPFSLDTVTWRANPDWAARRGYAGAEFERILRASIAFAHELRAEAVAGGARQPILVSGVLGPRDDGYSPATLMSADEAADYHRRQLEIFADPSSGPMAGTALGGGRPAASGSDAVGRDSARAAAGTRAAADALLGLAGGGGTPGAPAPVDYAAALTLTYPAEAIGIATAAREIGIPIVISFTVETDGRLPGGQSLRDAVAEVDGATDGAPAYFGVNCAHPDHLPADLAEPWGGRVAAFRANGSRRSHAELDALDVLDPGDPADLGRCFAELHERMPGLTVLGGCCGTDDRHIRAIARAVLGAP